MGIISILIAISSFFIAFLGFVYSNKRSKNALVRENMYLLIKDRYDSILTAINDINADSDRDMGGNIIRLKISTKSKIAIMEAQYLIKSLKELNILNTKAINEIPALILLIDRLEDLTKQIADLK